MRDSEIWCRIKFKSRNDSCQNDQKELRSSTHWIMLIILQVIITLPDNMNSKFIIYNNCQWSNWTDKKKKLMGSWRTLGGNEVLQEDRESNIPWMPWTKKYYTKQCTSIAAKSTWGTNLYVTVPKLPYGSYPLKVWQLSKSDQAM